MTKEEFEQAIIDAVKEQEKSPLTTSDEFRGIIRNFAYFLAYGPDYESIRDHIRNVWALKHEEWYERGLWDGERGYYTGVAQFWLGYTGPGDYPPEFLKAKQLYDHGYIDGLAKSQKKKE